VTGAGRGIGRATALRLAADGARVVGVARTAGELDAVAAETGGVSVPADLGEPGACAHIVAEAQRLAGPIAVLVNNAAIGSAGERPVWEQEPSRWREAMALNLDAPFQLTRLLLPGMLERRTGRIVMVCSLASLGTGVTAGMSAYAASKHGLLGLARAIAVEVAPYGVTCNAVLPGSVRTRASERKVLEEATAAGIDVDEAWRRRAERTVAGRLVEADEVAAVVAFLATDAASGVNGEAVGVALQASG
jgi:NAD(P)-dependent dehydrogenase (short-subunit alcohol dehydrogenase family)